MAEKAERRHVRVMLTGTHHSIRRVLFAHAVKPPLVSYERDIAEALERTRKV